MKNKELRETLSKFDDNADIFGASTINNVLHIHDIDAAIYGEGKYIDGKEGTASGVFIGSNVTIDNIAEAQE